MEMCRKRRPEGGPRLLKLRKECVKMVLHLSRVWQSSKRIHFHLKGFGIARAMLRSADYLLHDEATSNLDATSAALVTEAMDRLMKDRTTVMIAHSYEAAKRADYVIVMRDGTVEAAGTPDELRASNAYYQMFSKSL